MMKQAFTKLGVFTLLSLLCPAFLYAQVVTDERMFSFEDPVSIIYLRYTL